MLRFITLFSNIVFVFKIGKTNESHHSNLKSQGRVWHHLNIKETNGNIACSTDKSTINLPQKKNTANRLTHANNQEKIFEDQIFQTHIKLTMHSLDSVSII